MGDRTGDRTRTLRARTLDGAEMTRSCRSMLVLTRMSGWGLPVLVGSSMGGEVVCTGESSSSSRSGVSERPSESLKLFSLGILGENQKSGSSRGACQRHCRRKALVVGVVRGRGERNVRITVHGRVQVLPCRRYMSTAPTRGRKTPSQIIPSPLHIPTGQIRDIASSTPVTLLRTVLQISDSGRRMRSPPKLLRTNVQSAINSWHIHRCGNEIYTLLPVAASEGNDTFHSRRV